ncbi:metal-dependent hydrolase [Halolamina sp. CBA1230]|uniref:metal-dependent hydrolase n=1 Tax=Halolamina sp. CBA1230 TaxID=1853690 RepID=UPI0009A22977|nr:metal-dependent hydrolase [Halolamina sp. CBA1230]QKY20478.1 metal-dependent hydrolase [Halolamina sp. CBA1230]
MLPWGHAAVGYLGYRLYTFLRHRRPPAGSTVLALAIGTQFPDLIDKPLSWTFGVLPSGRSLGHSLLVFAVVAAVLFAVARDRSARTQTALFAFGFGWVSHMFSDGYTVLLGRDTCVNYLLWPLAACPYSESGRSIIPFLLNVEFTGTTQIGVGLAVVAGIVWLLDGAPGVWLLLRRGRDQLR